MGVHGLWKLIEPSGKIVPLDTLEGKILAVDISIWLHQAIKGYQDSKGSPMPNAHLLTIYNRVCKLLYFRIKPVFVFDGGVPALKKETIAKRNQLKSKNQSEASKIQKQLINTLLKHTAVTKVLSEKTRAELGSQAKKIPTTKSDNMEDIFILPPSQSTYESLDSCDESYDETSGMSDSSPTKYFNIHDVDEQSLQFKNLPADVRHEILTDLKETRKQNSWGRIHELPKQSDDFATYQMRRLLKRYSIQTCLEEAEKEMGGATLSLNELESLMNDHGVITENKGNRIASDENTRYLYIKDVKKALESTRLKDIKKKAEEKLMAADNEAMFQNHMLKATEFLISEEREIHTIIHTSSIDGNSAAAMKLSQQSPKETANSSKNLNENSDLADDKEFQRDLEAAIKLSLQEIPSTSQNISQIHLVKESSSTSTDTTPMSSQEILAENPSEFSIYLNSLRDSDFNSSEDDEVNLDDGLREGHKAADKIFSAAKNYMMEYGGLTHAGVEELFGHKQEGNNAMKRNKMQTVTSTNLDVENINLLQTSAESMDDVRVMSHSDSSLDDFLEVSNENKADSNYINDECNEKETTALQIGFNIKEELVDDIFSDIFEGNPEADTTVTIIKAETKFSPASNDTIERNSLADFSSSDTFKTINLLASEDLETQSAIKNSSNPMIQELISSSVTVDDLLKLKTSLNQASMDLMADRGTKERLAGNISDQMYNEAQDLLTLFGIPYIIAPMEAESQCAFLNQIGLTDGTITDDSDIWLFGGKTVYKNFFNYDKQVLEFRSESIHHHFKLSRTELISLAMLVGSDYTTGIQGIGPVTALEILAAFPSKNNLEIITSLEGFRDWFKSGKRVSGRGKAFLRNKLKNISLHEGFPSLSVLKAYLEPNVETSKESFTWGKPRVEALINYTREKFGWNAKKVNDTLDPVLRRLSDNSCQRRIQDYFKTVYKPSLNTSMQIKEKLSKRVQKALGTISQRGVENTMSSSDEDIRCDDSETYQVLKKTKKLSREKNSGIRAEIAAKLKVIESDGKHGDGNLEVKKPRLANLHKKEAIPQKELAKSSYLQSKMKAIEVFRKSSKGPGYVKKQKKAARLPPKVDAELSESDSD